MKKTPPPKTYHNLKEKHPDFIAAVEALGKTVHEKGPIAEKTSQLIQLAAAVAIRSEGATHSHTRRALAAGADADEIYHTLMLLTSTIGFPTVVAGLTWVDDIIKK